ncbi:MAG: T9SS type A sorting domain-containing protein [Chitinophagales bacterium]|nr:T9SS type A sorting domain-containing protein [Chitinophagales bacterium]MDW8427454.1 T9SS type A sorting domain-containing protein [Chitinophagales bacterium]
MRGWSFLLLGWLALEAGKVFAQSVWHLNYATSIGNGCYQLTISKDGQRGSAWKDQLLNLTEPFSLYYLLNFGSKDQGADGIAIVFHQDPLGYAAIGFQGADMGYASASYGNDSIAPSLIIEFDTYNNGSWLYNDIVDDHCQINAGGIPSWTLAFAVPTAGPGVNVEDNNYHLVQVTWDPVTMLLQVYFDCNLIQSLNVDLVNWLFAGNPIVYSGLTAATGKANNNQYFCELWHSAGNDLTFCPGTPVTLQASSNFQSISWSPTTGLSCANCLTPTANPPGPMTYVLTGTYNCLTVTDTVKLTVNCTPLPVELQYFDGYCSNGTVQLVWHTASELNNSHFEVERSDDGKNFETIARIQGAGTTSQPQRYTYRDANLPAGNYYYRLRQVDLDQTANYSSVIRVPCKGPITAAVFPNPAKERLMLRMVAEEQTARVQLMSLSGKTVFDLPLALDGQPQLFDFDLSNVPPGLYIMTVRTLQQAVNLPLAVSK